MPKENEKQLTAMQQLIAYKNDLIKNQKHKYSAYEILNLIDRKADELIATTERQQLIDSYDNGFSSGYDDAQGDGATFEDGKQYFEQTFKTQ